MYLSTNVCVISNGIVNCYLLFNERQTILIDTGLPGFQKRIFAVIRKTKNEVSTLSSVLITHSDADHYGSLQFLSRSFKIKSYSSEIEAASIRIGTSSRELKPDNLFERMFLYLSKPLFYAPPVSTIMPVPIGKFPNEIEEIEVIDSKGHTPGHISYYLPAQKILFAGDSISLNHGKPVPSSGMNTWDKDLAEKSFSKQMALKPNVIAAGHGLIRFKE